MPDLSRASKNRAPLQEDEPLTASRSSRSALVNIATISSPASASYSSAPLNTMPASSMDTPQHQQGAIMASPLSAASITSSTNVSVRPTLLDLGDDPPIRRTSVPYSNDDDVPLKLHPQPSEDSENSYRDSIAQEFEGYRQEYYMNHVPKNNSTDTAASFTSSGNRCSNKRCCHLFLAALVLQVLTVFILLISYLVLKNNKQEPTQNNNNYNNIPTGGVPLGEYTSGVYLTNPPSEIYERCTYDNIETDAGLKACYNLCKPSSCCHLSHLEEGSCWLDNVDACHEYTQACSVLNPTSETLYGHKYSSQRQASVNPNALLLWENPDDLSVVPDYLFETCQAAFVLSGEWQSTQTSAATETCQETCNEARCCWDTTLSVPSDRCWTHPYCDSYVKACRILAPTRQESLGQNAFSGGFELTVPTAPQKLSQFCHPDKIQNNLQDLLACQQACIQSECCWNDSLMDTQRCSYDPECPPYVQACSVLNDPFWPPEDGDVDVISGDETSTNNSNVGLDVTSDSITTNGTDATNDTDDSAEQYYPPEIIWDACYNHIYVSSSTSTNQQPTLCEKVCAPGSCCFDPNYAGCPSSYEDNFCDRFHPCHVLVEGNTAASPPSYVQEACSNLQDLSECVTLCGTATCCFTSDINKACAATRPDLNCDDYSACEILYRAKQRQQHL